MKQLLLSAACIALLSACGNTADKPGNSTETTTGEIASASGDNLITFKANGETVNTAGLTISRSELMPGQPLILNFTSDMHKEKRTININVAGTTAGTYTLTNKPTGTIGLYFPDYGEASNAYTFYNGTVVLSEVDTLKNIVNGTFSGEAKNEAGETVKITDGKIINGTLTPGVLRMPE